MKIVLASNNAGKIRELQTLLNTLDLQVLPQSDFSVADVPETGFTFVENALIKARHACEATNLPAIADDSGLEVLALHGAPGIYSARYAGEKATSQDNIKKLLQELNGIPEEDRIARFHCVLIYLAHAKDPTPLICQGTWEGTILKAPRGEQGFGYDPVFFDPKKNVCAAEMSLAEKNQISHRGLALKKLVEQLPTKILRG